MITEAVLEEVLMDIQRRSQNQAVMPEDKLAARCENYMIDVEVVARVVRSVISVNMSYGGNGLAVIHPDGVAAEAFITGVICGRMEINGGT